MIHKTVTFGGANILKTEKQKVFILNVTKGMMVEWVAGPRGDVMYMRLFQQRKGRWMICVVKHRTSKKYKCHCFGMNYDLIILINRLCERARELKENFVEFGRHFSCFCALKGYLVFCMAK